MSGCPDSYRDETGAIATRLGHPPEAETVFFSTFNWYNP